MSFPLTLLKEQTLKNRTDRKCGSCTACCTIIGVKELNKERWTKCVHEAGCCEIYEDRPQSCRSFHCMWLSGYIEGDERRRPDNLGIIFVQSDNDKLPIVACWECYSGAAEKNIFLLKQLATKVIVYILPFGEPQKWKVLGPARYRDAIQDMLVKAMQMP